MKRRAFTLVELMVGATLVVTLLGGVLAPTLASSRLNAHRDACLNHLKQQMLGCLLFADDHKDNYPLELTYRETKDGGAGQYLHGAAAVPEADLDQKPLHFVADRAEIAYFGLTGPVPASAQVNAVFINRIAKTYIGSARVFNCPAAAEAGMLPNAERSLGMNDAFSYGINQRMRLGKRPSATIVIGDMARTAGRNPWKELTDAPSDAEARGLNHRGQGFNMAFMDGHAEKVTMDKFVGRGLGWTGDADDIFMSTGNGRDGAQPVEDSALY